MPPEPHLLQLVLGIWAEILGSPRGGLGPDSNFFLSGGDSLDLMRVLVRVREHSGAELQLRDVARFSTPRRMAECCAQVGVPRARPAAASVAEDAQASSYPCTATQTAMWLAEQGSGAAVYNTAVILHLSGQLRQQVLGTALNVLLVEHEVLQSRYRFDVRRQRLIGELRPLRELQLASRKMARSKVSSFLRERAAQPFEFRDGPLWRFELLASGTDRWALLLCLHHTIVDGWSARVLLQRLATVYNALLKQGNSLPRERDREFRIFASGQQHAAAKERDWWRSYLDGADRLRAAPFTATRRWPFATACVEEKVDRAAHADICRLAGKLRLVLAAPYLAALRLALHMLGGVTDLAIGMPVNVRTTSAQETAIGCFVNLLVTRTAIAAELTPLQAVQAVNEDLIKVLSRRDVAFTDLTAALKPALLASGNAWCDILFAFQKLPVAVVVFDGLDARLERLAPRFAQHPLKVEFIYSEASCTCRIEFAVEEIALQDVRALQSMLRFQLATLAALALHSS